MRGIDTLLSLKRSLTRRKSLIPPSGCTQECTLCLYFEYGEAKEGYWTRDKIVEQIKKAVEVAEVKFPPEQGWTHMWIFDHSSRHGAMAEDALDVNQMNVKPGGKLQVMRDGFWNGKPQAMNYALGVPKGLHVVLEERGVDTRHMKADEMKSVLASHADFKNKKTRVERVN